MKEENSRLEWLKFVISVLGLIGVIVSITVGFKAQTEAIDHQWKQEFFKQKMELYQRASETAATIAVIKSTNQDSAQLNKAIRNFNILYRGPMAVLEDPEAENAMINFKTALDHNASSETLLSLSLYLSHVLRNEANLMISKDGVPTKSHYGENKEILKEMKKLLR